MPDPIKTEISRCDTWPKVLEYNYKKYGDRYKAMRFKHYGIWQSYTWQDYYFKVKYLALGLLALGFKAGDKLLIVGDNAPEWYFAELAAQSNRGISVGLYSDLSAAEIKYAIRNCGTAFAMVEDQEQVDKLAHERDQLLSLKKVIYWRYKGLSNQKDTLYAGYRDVLRIGQEYEKAFPGTFEKNIAEGRADDVCAIIYTSGATGENPKGTLHSFRSLRYASDYFLEMDHWEPTDNLVSPLPPAWITEQWLAFGCHLLSASIINFAEEAETQEQDIREIGPTTVFYNSRLWERQAGRVRAKASASRGLKRWTYRFFMPVGFKIADYKSKGQRPAWYWRFFNIFANALLFRPVRDSLGLPHARICYSSGSTLSSEAFRFYHALNVPLKNLYGSAEAGAISTTSSTETLPGAAGRVRPGAVAQISPHGEIMIRHPGVFLGYHNNPGLTAEVLKDGWVYTGDSGRIADGGQLIFTDRTRDLVRLSGDEFFSPQDIESRLKYSPYIKDAWILAGPGRSYVSAVIIIDAENTGAWADRRKVIYTTFSDLSQKPEILNLIKAEIKRVNGELPSGSRIKKYVNLNKEFDPDESELTRSRKLRKSFLEEKYTDLINGIYSDKPTINMEAQVNYQDGRTGNIKTELKIQSVGEERS